jgi:cysteine-rich repeat protein
MQREPTPHRCRRALGARALRASGPVSFGVSSPRALFGYALVSCALLAAACSPEESSRSVLPTPPIGGGGQGGAAGGGGGGAGGGGEGGAATCGDGVRQPDEACEAEDLAGATCATLGLGTGALSCRSDCTLDISGCSPAEDCFDGLDNDGDGLRDCEDPDCAPVCADSCASPIVIAAPVYVIGDSTGHANTLASSCASGAGSGPELVYQVTAAEAGVLDFTLLSDVNLTLSARSQCDDAGTELGCSNRVAAPPGAERLTVPVALGDTVLVVLDGFDDGEFGVYSLKVDARVPGCGDLHTDPGEECDDGSQISGDGCSATCTVETTESEPANNAFGSADLYPPASDRWYARIYPAGDQDYLSAEVTVAGSTIVAQIHDLGDGGCANHLLDTVLDILGTDGSTLLASDDNGGEGSCSLATAAGLAAGTYYVRVAASSTASPSSFGYALDVTVQAP